MNESLSLKRDFGSPRFMTTAHSIDSLKNIATRLRIHSIRATTEAGSGHPTTCLSAADVVAALFFHTMRYEPKNPKDPCCDRFVLSKGHAAPLLWGVWCEAGLLSEKELLNLRKIDSDLEGHPTPRFPWVDVSSGSLGQGLSVGCGMAWDMKNLDANDARAFVLLGDGECAEGSVWEAAAFAGHAKLNNLIAIVDVNRLGQSEAAMYGHNVETYARKFEANGWKAICIDGHDMNAIVAALDVAMSETKQPVAIVAKTLKGGGVSFLADAANQHGKPLSKEDCARAIKELGEPEFLEKHFRKPSGKTRSYPSAVEIEGPRYALGDKVATRAAYGTALVKLGKSNPKVVVLDGDTKNSTFSEKFLQVFPERFIECYIAEQNMVGMALGLAARGKIPFASTFGAFFTRTYDQIRMSAISQKGLKLCGSHAGVSIGEDGPSQMALEDLAMMRAIPGCAVLLPADAVATEKLVTTAAKTDGMVFIRTQRPATPVLYDNKEPFPIGGSKVLRQSSHDRVTLVAAGVTLIEALNACDFLKKEGIAVRVIDQYSLKPVDPTNLKKAAAETTAILTIEDHYPQGGLGDAVLDALALEHCPVHKIAVTSLPRSGKPNELLALYGLDCAGIVKKVKEIL